MRSYLRLLVGGLLVSVPLMMLGSGCGGGNDLVSPTPTPLATSTATPTGSPTPTATSTQGTTQTSNFTLSNGQRAILKTTTSASNKITGTIQILAPGADTQTTRALSVSLKVGTFQITGTFTPPRGYNITVTDGGQTLFTMSGLFPTTTQTGTYSLTVNGQTDTGIIPKIGSTTPTATPKPTTAPTSQPGSNVQVNLTFTPSSDSNFVNVSPLTGKLTFSTPVNSILGTVTTTNTTAANSFLYLIPFIKAQQGLSRNLADLASGGITSGTYLNQVGANGLSHYFVPESGTLTLTAITSTSATITFKDAVYTANEGNAARGKVTINGTVSGPFTTQ